MRFASSLALLSLTGLGLAVPASKSSSATSKKIAAPTPAPQSSDSSLTGLLGGLRARDEDTSNQLAELFYPDSSNVGDTETPSVNKRGEDADAGQPPDSDPSGTDATIVVVRDSAKSKNHGKDRSKTGPTDKPQTTHKPKSKPKHKPQSKSKTHDKTASKRREPVCLTSRDVDTVVDAYVRILSKWNETADAKYLAEDFVDHSDSINILAGIPLGSATFPTKAAFIQHENTQPDNLPLVVTHKSPISCDEIALIWTATFGAAQKPVRGVTILGASYNATCAPAPLWQIRSIDVEFNSIAYLVDIGGSYKLPGQ